MGWRARAWWWLVENEGLSGAGQCCFWAPSSQECLRCEVGQGQASHLPPLLFWALPTLTPSHLGGSLARGLPIPLHPC